MDGREDLRRRYVKAETTLFKLRYTSDDTQEREEFLKSRDFGWVVVRSYVTFRRRQLMKRD